MRSKTLALRLAGTIFGLVTVLHLLRVMTGVPITIGGWLMPIWVNTFGMIATGCLSGWMWWLSSINADESSNYDKERYRYD